uniref:Wsv282-like protein n=1 Tax=Sicyonia whispovirus TaxID=2984283 RepID=A0A9C7C715_9VIRU|nr:MAG: wsv282-like protein [Sicyonia whispovirus]
MSKTQGLVREAGVPRGIIFNDLLLSSSDESEPGVGTYSCIDGDSDNERESDSNSDSNNGSNSSSDGDSNSNANGGADTAYLARAAVRPGYLPCLKRVSKQETGTEQTPTGLASVLPTKRLRRDPTTSKTAVDEQPVEQDPGDKSDCTAGRIPSPHYPCCSARYCSFTGTTPAVNAARRYPEEMSSSSDSDIDSDSDSDTIGGGVLPPGNHAGVGRATKYSSDDDGDGVTEMESEDDEFDPDQILQGSSKWYILMGKRPIGAKFSYGSTRCSSDRGPPSPASCPSGTKAIGSAKELVLCNGAPGKPSPPTVLGSISTEYASCPPGGVEPHLPSEFAADECPVPDKIVSLFASLLEKETFSFSQSVSFLRLIRQQANVAMNSAFVSMLSSSGMRATNRFLAASALADDFEKVNVSMSRVAKVLSNIAAKYNKDNGYSAVSSLLASAMTESHNPRKRSSPRVGGNISDVNPRFWNGVIFYREIHTVISLYLSLVYIQRAMKNHNINSTGYPEGMVSKMLSIISKIPQEEMSREKFVSVGRDALYLYQNIITDMTGSKYSKRLRTPQQQADFCYIIAMLVNDIPFTSDVSLAGKATSLVQFASAMYDPAYRLAVHKISCVFNSSYSIFKVLHLDRQTLLTANQILSILSARNGPLSERKPRTVTQSVYLYMMPHLRDRLRTSGLASEESSLGTAVKLVAQQLSAEGVTFQSLEEGCSIVSGSYETDSGTTLKCFGSGLKDIKTVALSVLLCERLRRRSRLMLPYY